MCEKHHWETVAFDENPTSETLAKIIYEQAVSFFSRWPGIRVEYIKIEETCTSECLYDGK
jgi:hypothetical protein